MKQDIQQIISQMTLEEKASLCSGLDFWHTKGIERLGIPSVMMTDGPHGLRKQRVSSDRLGLFDSVPATCFPSAAGLASSWDRELIGKVGIALGEECQAENIAILLGPGANIKRSPLCGRNFEYFSEDPYLSSELAAEHIIGVQSQGVGTSLKHFAANNQEHRRMTTDAIVDERTLREIYLASFEGAIKKGRPWTVMCAYNKVNGSFASENEYLLSNILKEEWGHEGFIVSDWGAVNERSDGLVAGLDLEMPSSGGEGDRKIVHAVQSGKLTEEILDRSVERFLRVIFKAVENQKPNSSYDVETHHRLAREVASESMVLLKNEDSILPLRRKGKIVLVGELAEKPRYQGGGSSHIKPTKLEDIRDEVARSAGSEMQVSYAQGYDLDSDSSDPMLLDEAVQAAKQADVAIVFAGLPDRYESEGYDRLHLCLPSNQTELINALGASQSNIVVVLSNGAPVEMPWVGNVKAVLETYLGGQALGGAIADLLFVDANPSGKLAETFPLRLSDNPSFLFFPGDGDRVEYKDGLYVGYRYYDIKQLQPLFPFGHGLSYTNFEYRDLTIDKVEMNDNDSATVSVIVKNTGSRAGKEIVQLYVSDLESHVSRPIKELKGFEKVSLEPGEEQTVTFSLNKRSFAYYNIDMKDWHIETGEFAILIGKSSANIVLEGTIKVNSTVPVIKKYTRNSTVGDLMGNCEATAILKEILTHTPFTNSNIGEEGQDMMAAFLKYMPLRGLTSFSAGEVTGEMLDSFLTRMNQIMER